MQNLNKSDLNITLHYLPCNILKHLILLPFNTAVLETVPSNLKTVSTYKAATGVILAVKGIIQISARKQTTLRGFQGFPQHHPMS
jgi:hypothetical protein